MSISPVTMCTAYTYNNYQFGKLTVDQVNYVSISVMVLIFKDFTFVKLASYKIILT